MIAVTFSEAMLESDLVYKTYLELSTGVAGLKSASTSDMAVATLGALSYICSCLVRRSLLVLSTFLMEKSLKVCDISLAGTPLGRERPSHAI